MRSFGYPQFPAHKKIHDKLRADVKSLHECLLAGERGIAYKIMDFLKDCLVTHIQQEDKKYGEYIARKRGVGAF